MRREVAGPAKGLKVRQVEGCAPAFQRDTMVNLHTAGGAASRAPPPVPIEGGEAGSLPPLPVYLPVVAAHLRLTSSPRSPSGHISSTVATALSNHPNASDRHPRARSRGSCASTPERGPAGHAVSSPFLPSCRLPLFAGRRFGPNGVGNFPHLADRRIVFVGVFRLWWGIVPTQAGSGHPEVRPAAGRAGPAPGAERDRENRRRRRIVASPQPAPALCRLRELGVACGVHHRPRLRHRARE